MRKGLLIVFLLVVLGLAGAFFVGKYSNRPVVSEPEQDAGQACTMEAKICPDGTAVGRTGPNCAFAPCPAAPTAPNGEVGDTGPIFEGGADMDVGVGDASVPSEDGTACVARGGSWDPQYEECVGVNQTQCTAIGGSYNGCASACRHQPDAEVCTLQCVEVCQL